MQNEKNTFLLAAALLSISSFASTPYSVYVNGENVNSDNCKDVLKDGGSVKYDDATGTLTLTNANLSYNLDVISFYGAGKKLKLVGNNTINGTGTSSYGLDAEDGLEIIGDGTLTITSRATGIYADDLSLSGGCTVIAYGDDYGVSCVGGALVINKSTLKAKGGDGSIISTFKLTLTGCAILSDHTYDATSHKFLDANSKEATDEIIIGVADSYSVYVLDKNVNSYNCNDILKDGGSVKYDNATKTLTLNNAHINYDGTAIAFYDVITINLVGHNSIAVTGNNSDAVDAEFGFNIAGNGTLSVVSESVGFWTGGLHISGGCNVNIAAKYGLTLMGEELSVDKSTLSVQGNVASISGAKKLTMTDVVLGTNHTYDATAQKFFDANGDEATDYILIEPKSGDYPVDAQWLKMGNPFSINDIDGKTFDLADYLKRGQYVFVFYFATWSSSCYDIHSKGILDAINALPNVTVVAVECTYATLEKLKGTSGDSQGDYTTVNGKPITYPIVVDNANEDAKASIAAIYEGYVPTMALITPEGYITDMYGTDWGFSGSSSEAAVVAAVEDVVKNAPKVYHLPLISLRNLQSRYEVNTKYDFNFDVLSVLPCGELSWQYRYEMSSFEETAKGATISWKTPGTKRIRVSATNNNGDGNIFETVSVVNTVYNAKANGYLSYSTDEYDDVIGGTASFSWAARFRAVDLNGVTQVEKVQFFSKVAHDYKLTIAQSEPDASAPGSTLYEKTYTVTDVDQWVYLPLDNPVAINSASDLWIIFSYSDDNKDFPAAGCSYVGNLNGSLISLDGTTWENVVTDYDLKYTWMIRCFTNVKGYSTIREFPYTWDFDDGTWQGWTQVNTDGDEYTWLPYYLNTAISSSEAGHSGDCCIMSESYRNEVGVLNPDNWLISPAIAMPAKAKLSWWEKQLDSMTAYSEKHAVYICSSNSIVDFMATTPVFEGEVMTTDYVQQVVDLGDKYAGQTVYIAFRHFDCYDGYVLCIDDISVDGDCSAVETVDNAQSTMRKYIRDGQVYIVRDGKTYNVLGTAVK